MSSVDNSEGESDVTINQTLVEDAKNIFKNLGSPELTNMFDMLVRSYENSRLETSKNDNANLEDTNVISKDPPKIERTTLWNLKTFILFALIPIRICGLYFMDVTSDLVQMLNLYKNCLNVLCAVSIGIVVSSYITTLLYIRLCEGFKWPQALSFPFIFSGNLWKHLLKCKKAITNGQDLPNVDPEHDKFSKKVSFFEVITESLPQLTLSNIIIRIYGVSDDSTTKFFQLFSLASSMLSLMVSFITRQIFLKPLMMPDFEKTLKGFCKMLTWKILYLVYLLCTALPIALYITCLFVVTIERRSTIELPIIMTAMLHPIVAIPIGFCAEFLGQSLSAKIFNNFKDSWKMKIIRRFFTYSMNVHLAMIAIVLCYLYAVWIPMELASNLNFENKPFDQCRCGPLAEFNITCVNYETENSFQNFFLGISIQPFLIGLLLTSITCHLVHSVIIAFPAPEMMTNFLFGKTEDKEVSMPKLKQNKRKIILGTLVLALFTGILASPYFLFGSHLNSVEKCQTIDNYDCTFPFKLDGHTFWTCSDSEKDGISPWCSTDADRNGDFKSIGECKPFNCQKICRISPDTTCNIHGVTDECADDKCNCKDGYTGDLCEYCEPFCMITDNSIQEGEVDVTSGEGVHCSCNISIIISGGSNGIVGNLAEVEVLEEDGDCELPSLPYSIFTSPIIFQHGKDVLLCGGEDVNSKKCLKLDFFNSLWTPFNNLSHPRVHSPAIQMKSETYLLGGTSPESVMTSDILSHDSQTWKKGPDIPSPGLNEGCGVRISDTDFLIIGGRNTRRILRFNTESNEWSNPSIELQFERVGHRCFMIDRKVIVTGGTDKNPEVVRATNSTEIIDLGINGEMYIRKGNDMNERRQTHGIGFIYIDNTPQIVIFGGFDVYPDPYPIPGYKDTVEIWNNANETWMTSNLTLNQGKFEFGFASLPTELLCPYFKLKKK